MTRAPISRRPDNVPGGSIRELDVVRLLAEVKLAEGRLPVGTMGTAVYRHRDGEAFEVEFTTPFPALLTLHANEIATLNG